MKFDEDITLKNNTSNQQIRSNKEIFTQSNFSKDILSLFEPSITQSEQQFSQTEQSRSQNINRSSFSYVLPQNMIRQPSHNFSNFNIQHLKPSFNQSSSNLLFPNNNQTINQSNTGPFSQNTTASQNLTTKPGELFITIL